MGTILLTERDGENVVILPGGDAWDFDRYEAMAPGRVRLAFDRVEANGLGHFTKHHPYLGHLIASELIEQPGQILPPVIDLPPIVELPPCVPCLPPGGTTEPPPPPPPYTPPVAVPEPATFVLVAVGLVAIAVRRACR